MWGRDREVMKGSSQALLAVLALTTTWSGAIIHRLPRLILHTVITDYDLPKALFPVQKHSSKAIYS